MSDEIERIAEGLSEEQRGAMIDCVVALSDAASNIGHVPSEEALFRLFKSFGEDPWGNEFMTYVEWAKERLKVRTHLQEQSK